MKLSSLGRAMSASSYPGRGIVLGLHAGGRNAAIAYFIMGRSVNSRNRVFVNDGDGIRTHEIRISPRPRARKHAPRRRDRCRRSPVYNRAHARWTSKRSSLA